MRGTIVLTIFLSLVFMAGNVQAQKCPETEPAYCSPQVFKSYEKPLPLSGLKAAHLFRLGSVNLAGLAIGSSNMLTVRELALKHAPVGWDQGYCTWYVNWGNIFASWGFNDQYLPHPSNVASDQAIAEFMGLISSHFDQKTPSFLSCAENYGYVALGCNGMKHRGPTLFGMLLAYSGCSAQNAADIVNGYWGLNGISPEVRLALIQAGYDLGRKNSDQSCRLRTAFEN